MAMDAGSSNSGIGDLSGLTTPTSSPSRRPFKSPCAGDGGDVESGEEDGAYCELVHDMGGDPLPDECDANGDVERIITGT